MPPKDPRPIVQRGETVTRGVECFEEQTNVVYNAMPIAPVAVDPISATASLFNDQTQTAVELGGAGVTEVAATIEDNKAWFVVASSFTQNTGYHTLTLTVYFTDGQIKKKIWRYNVK